MPVRAGTFPGGGNTIIIPLDRRVPQGAIVAVTLERKPGGDAAAGQDRAALAGRLAPPAALR